jgi:hypothetical protein
MEENKTIEIQIHDGLNFSDSRNGNGKKRRPSPPEKRPAGLVEVYEKNKETDEKQLVRKSNLVVYKGREWIAQRLFNKNNSLLAWPDTSAAQNEYIGWVGVGEGGATNPLSPDSPTNRDDDLLEEYEIIESPATGYADLRDGSYYKKVIDPSNVTFEVDDSNESRYLTVKVQFNMEADDANSGDLSEAGLFTAIDDDGPFHLFARVTFPTITKSEGRDLLFVWYIYT